MTGLWAGGSPPLNKGGVALSLSIAKQLRAGGVAAGEPAAGARAACHARAGPAPAAAEGRPEARQGRRRRREGQGFNATALTELQMNGGPYGGTQAGEALNAFGDLSAAAESAARSPEGSRSTTSQASSRAST